MSEISPAPPLPTTAGSAVVSSENNQKARRKKKHVPRKVFGFPLTDDVAISSVKARCLEANEPVPPLETAMDIRAVSWASRDEMVDMCLTVWHRVDIVMAYTGSENGPWPFLSLAYNASLDTVKPPPLDVINIEAIKRTLFLDMDTTPGWCELAYH